MAPPPKLDYAHNIYIHITAPAAPPTRTLSVPIPSSSTSRQGQSSQAQAFRLEYVGPVGELQDEHIYALQPVTTSPAAANADGLTGKSSLEAIAATKADTSHLSALTTEVRKMEGVQAARILQEKQRAKR
jgi:hypothetical protein